MSTRSRPQSRGNPAKQPPWQPLEPGIMNPAYLELSALSGAALPLAVYGNNLYQITVHGVGDMLHLSIKSHDRSVMRDWRHLQAIKNEIAGPERVAVEIFPPESRLVDTSNQYHLWVFPEGYELPFGFDSYLVSSDAQVEMFNAGSDAGEHKGRQRPFQENLPVATTRNLQANAHRSMMDDATTPMHQKVPPPR